MAIFYETENGTIVSYSTAEKQVVGDDGFLHFLDVHGEEVGRQPISNPIPPAEQENEHDGSKPVETSSTTPNGADAAGQTGPVQPATGSSAADAEPKSPVTNA